MRYRTAQPWQNVSWGSRALRDLASDNHSVHNVCNSVDEQCLRNADKRYDGHTLSRAYKWAQKKGYKKIHFQKYKVDCSDLPFEKVLAAYRGNIKKLNDEGIFLTEFDVTIDLAATITNSMQSILGWDPAAYDSAQNVTKWQEPAQQRKLRVKHMQQWVTRTLPHGQFVYKENDDKVSKTCSTFLFCWKTRLRARAKGYLKFPAQAIESHETRKQTGNGHWVNMLLNSNMMLRHALRSQYAKANGYTRLELTLYPSDQVLPDITELRAMIKLAKRPILRGATFTPMADQIKTFDEAVKESVFVYDLVLNDMYYVRTKNSITEKIGMIKFGVSYMNMTDMCDFLRDCTFAPGVPIVIYLVNYRMAWKFKEKYAMGTADFHTSWDFSAVPTSNGSRKCRANKLKIAEADAKTSTSQSSTDTKDVNARPSVAGHVFQKPTNVLHRPEMKKQVEIRLNVADDGSVKFAVTVPIVPTHSNAASGRISELQIQAMVLRRTGTGLGARSFLSSAQGDPWYVPTRGITDMHVKESGWDMSRKFPMCVRGSKRKCDHRSTTNSNVSHGTSADCVHALASVAKRFRVGSAPLIKELDATKSDLEEKERMEMKAARARAAALESHHASDTKRKDFIAKFESATAPSWPYYGKKKKSIQTNTLNYNLEQSKIYEVVAVRTRQGRRSTKQKALCVYACGKSDNIHPAGYFVPVKSEAYKQIQHFDPPFYIELLAPPGTRQRNGGLRGYREHPQQAN